MFFQKWIIIGTLSAALALGGVWYYDHTSSKQEIRDLIESTATLKKNAQAAKDAAETNAKTIADLQRESEFNAQRFEELSTAFQIIRSQKAELDARLNGHDLTAIGIEKPELIEKIINNASDNVLRCFELVSGSPKNAKELSAKTEKEFNNECPWMFYQE